MTSLWQEDIQHNPLLHKNLIHIPLITTDQPLCLEVTLLRRVRREDHLINSGVFLPTGGLDSLWDAVEKNWRTVQGVVHGLFRGRSRETEMEGPRHFGMEQAWEESWKQGQEGLMPCDHGADPCAGLAMPVALPCLSPCQ